MTARQAGGKKAAAKRGGKRSAAAAGGGTVKARVTVYPRREILDPQGKAIRDALGRIGFEGVAAVRAGKSFEIELTAAGAAAAREALTEMCERLLANPVVEDYEIEVA